MKQRIGGYEREERREEKREERRRGGLRCDVLSRAVLPVLWRDINIFTYLLFEGCDLLQCFFATCSCFKHFININIYTCINIYIDIYTCMCIFMCVCVCVCVCVCGCVCESLRVCLCVGVGVCVCDCVLCVVRCVVVWCGVLWCVVRVGVCRRVCVGAQHTLRSFPQIF